MTNYLEKSHEQFAKRDRLTNMSLASLYQEIEKSGLFVVGKTMEPSQVMFEDISSLIHDFTAAAQTHGQMLPKDPDTLYQVFSEGGSFILADQYYVPDGQHRENLAHIAAYPLITFPFSGGDIVVVELGSLIKGGGFKGVTVNGGFTVGETLIAGLQKQMSQIMDAAGGQIVFMATQKRNNVESAFWESGLDVVPYESTALLTHSTCVCSSAGESTYHNGTDGCASCQYRMQYPTNNGNVIPVNDLFTLPPISRRKIEGECRQVIHNPKQALQLEDLLRKQYANIRGKAFEQPKKINRDVSKDIYYFYTQMGAHIS